MEDPKVVSSNEQMANAFIKLVHELSDHRVRQGITPVYSNTLHFDASDLDFTILFGQTRPFPDPALVDWRAAVTLPWVTAKLLSYYLQINLKIYESEHATIKIPSTMLPPVPGPKDSEATNRNDIVEFVEKLRADLLSEP
jgi:hypothetical protein